MALSLSLGPIRIAKRQWKRPWSVDPFGQDDSIRDPEKRGLAFDVDSDVEDSPASSRVTSSSSSPMLPRLSSLRHMASAYDNRIPKRRQFNFYFTIVTASLLVTFILILTRLGARSNNDVAKTPPPPKPFPYESFPFLKRYHGGIRTLIPRSRNQPEYPGDEEQLRAELLNSTTLRSSNVKKRQLVAAGLNAGNDDEEVRAENQFAYTLPAPKVFDPFMEHDPERRECFLDPGSSVRIPKLRAYDGCTAGFPDPVMGSYDLFGLRNDVCFDRFGRLGPYGFGYSTKWGGTGAGLEGDREGIEQVWVDDPEVDYSNVRWVDVMERCAEKNKHRFEHDLKTSGIVAKRQLDSVEKSDATEPTTNADSPADALEIAQPQPATVRKSRTCIVIRAWNEYKYNAEDLMYLRGLISELSIQSGTEYVLHFLIQVKDNDIPIWSNDEVYQQVLNDSLPEEFHGMGTLWTDHQLMLIYGGMDAHPFRNIHLHGAYRSAFMPLQYFAHKHPEFDFFWNWELDIRYTGHWYHLFDRIGAWAKTQPRKGLWERNARFYVPTVHGSWEDFRQMVRVQTEHGTSTKANLWGGHMDSPAKDPTSAANTIEKPIWGAEAPLLDELDSSKDPVPPTTYAKDNYEWGVGEDADLITFNPLFDPENTEWNLEKDVTGYKIVDDKYPPRRVAIVTASRLSKRLLATMHDETSVHKRSMFSEMWPASCALQHGYKAVFAPHPVYIDRRWPTDYLAAVYNAGRNGASGGAPTTAFNDVHQGNFRGVTWYYISGFAGNLWRRWLGYRVNNDGGEAFELANEGRMCLPALLIHPVKQFDLIYEHREEPGLEPEQSSQKGSTE